MDVAALPHHSSSRSGGVLEDAVGGAEVGSAFRFANTSEFRFEVVGWHGSTLQIREDLGADASGRK
jgi:hypothetical protein